MSPPDQLKNLPVMAGHGYMQLLHGEGALEPVYPPAMLDAHQAGRLAQLLTDTMPRGSFILDLWDWDCHFDDQLESDWLYRGAFGADESVAECAATLAGYFMEQVAEHDLDYGHWNDEGEFAECVNDEAQAFIRSRRRSLCKSVFNAHLKDESDARQAANQHL